MATRGNARTSARAGFWIGLAGFVLLALVPLGDPAAAPARKMAGIAFLMACWWVTEALPLAATGLVPLVAFPFLGLLPAAETSREYGHHLILLFLAGFLLARALTRWGLDRRLALAVVATVGSSPRRIVLGLMVATAFLSMWVSNSATAAMMMPVGLALVEHAAAEAKREGLGVDTRPGHFRFGTAVMLGIAWAASIGGVGTIVGTPPNVLLVAMLEDAAGVRIGFAEWMLVGVPVVVLTLPLVWLWLVGVAYRPEIDRLPGGRQVVRRAREQLGPVGPGGRRVAAIVLLTALAWITRPLWDDLLPDPGMLKDASVGIAGALALFLVPSGEEDRPALLDASAWREIPWNVLLLFGGGLALAKGFVSSGLAKLLGGAAVGLAHVPLPVFLLVLGAAVIVLTEFASNTASTAMVLPLLAATAAAVGLPAPLLMIPAALAASMAFMMPAGTPPNAIVFGTGYVRIRQMLLAGIVADLVALGVIELVTLGIVPRLFG